MSATATQPVTTEQAAAPTAAAAPPAQTNDQKLMDLAKKHGVVDKIKKAIYKKLGLTPKKV